MSMPSVAKSPYIFFVFTAMVDGFNALSFTSFGSYLHGAKVLQYQSPHANPHSLFCFTKSDSSKPE
jgi:hypothetical protein